MKSPIMAKKALAHPFRHIYGIDSVPTVVARVNGRKAVDPSSAITSAQVQLILSVLVLPEPVCMYMHGESPCKSYGHKRIAYVLALCRTPTKLTIWPYL